VDLDLDLTISESEDLDLDLEEEDLNLDLPLWDLAISLLCYVNYHVTPQHELLQFHVIYFINGRNVCLSL